MAVSPCLLYETGFVSFCVNFYPYLLSQHEFITTSTMIPLKYFHYFALLLHQRLVFAKPQQANQLPECPASEEGTSPWPTGVTPTCINAPLVTALADNCFNNHHCGDLFNNIQGCFGTWFPPSKVNSSQVGPLYDCMCTNTNFNLA